MFHLPDTPHSLRCICCTGGERSLALLPVYSAMMELDQSYGLHAMKADGEDQNDGETPTPDDPFYRDEIALAALLGSLWMTGIKQVQPQLDAVFSGVYHADAITTALQSTGAAMSNIVTADGGRKIASQVDSLISTGARHGKGGSAANAGITQHVGPTTVGKGTILEDSPSAKQVMDGIVDSTKYYTNRYFNEIIVPAIQADVQRLIDDTGHTHQPNLTPIREALDKRLATVPYWRLVANAAASRGFHYGMIKAGSMTGHASYTWNSIIDNKTSQICISLDGREFRIADAVSLMERAAGASPADAKKIMPWPTAAQAKAIPNMTNSALRDAGFIVPPAHGNCRSTISLNVR